MHSVGVLLDGVARLGLRILGAVHSRSHLSLQALVFLVSLCVQALYSTNQSKTVSAVVYESRGSHSLPLVSEFDDVTEMRSVDGACDSEPTTTRLVEAKIHTVRVFLREPKAQNPR
jgi:hypothetical protein